MIKKMKRDNKEADNAEILQVIRWNLSGLIRQNYAGTSIIKSKGNTDVSEPVKSRVLFTLSVFLAFFSIVTCSMKTKQK